MLTTFLTILKITGIVLLVIIALILLIILLVLFVPIRYKLDANVPETEFDKGFDIESISASARFSWLLHFISGGINFPKDKEFYVKVLGIKVFPRKKKDSEKDTVKESDTGKDKDKVTDREDFGEDSEHQILESTGSEAEIKSGTENEDDDKNLIEIFTEIVDTIENILKTPQNVFEKMQYTISRVCGKIDMIKTTLENDIFKRAFALVKKKLIKIIRMILPDKCDISLLLGTGDPANTASVMAFYGALYPVLYDKVSFEPDFDRAVCRADVHLKGHVTVFTIIYSVLVCYFNKDVKKVIRRFKKIMKSS